MVKITLQKYANIKQSTIDDVIKYAADMKGISIPYDAGYELDYSVLKKIDPIFYHALLLRYITDNQSKTLHGIVKEIGTDGVYVDVDGHTGHVSFNDWSWNHIPGINSDIKVGDKIYAIVLGCKDLKINLGRKQLLPDPLVDAAEFLYVGLKTKGKVRRIVKQSNQIWVELSKYPAVCGVCLSNNYTDIHEGDDISCIIDKIDIERHQLILRIENNVSNSIKKQIRVKTEPVNHDRQAPNEAIGIIKFYDFYKGFGIIISKHIEQIPCDPNTVSGIYLNGSKWQCETPPSANKWVVFTPNNISGGRWSAINARPLTYDKTGLMQAMAYRGSYARIEGYDTKGDKYDLNVLCHVISTVNQNNADGGREVINAFAEFIASMEMPQIPNIISEFLQDLDLRKMLISMLSQLENYQSDIPIYRTAIKFLSSAVENTIFSSKNIRIFAFLPPEFNYTAHTDWVANLLDASSKSSSTEVLSWLRHHENFIEDLLSLDRPYSMELLYNIFEIRQDFTIFQKSGETWNDIYLWLNVKSEATATNFLVDFFRDCTYDFVRQKNITAVLTESALKRVIPAFLDEAECQESFLRTAASIFASSDLDIIAEYIVKRVDISYVYGQLGSYLNALVQDDELSVEKFIQICEENNISTNCIFKDLTVISDEMRIVLFIRSFELSYLSAIEDCKGLQTWINKQDTTFITQFLQKCCKILTKEVDHEINTDLFSTIDGPKFMEAIRDLPEDEQLQILQLCSDEYAQTLVVQYFASTRIYEIYAHKQWCKIESQMSYVAFDIESDGDIISEFAYHIKGRTDVFWGEEQLIQLLYTLKDAEIIVGHRIKEWDLKVLESKGYKSNAFVWDTLEIEILLNPCRYSYALHTTHTAKADAELVEMLFWNQLYRLSLDDALCAELSDFLPKSINSILNVLRQPLFANYFESTYRNEERFYQTLDDIDDRVIDQLRRINNDKQHALVVAPQRLWPRISEYVNLSFVQLHNSIDFLSISSSALARKPLSDAFINTILNRFVTLSRTPIVANIAQYLRINYLSDEILADYTEVATGNIDCADMSIIMDNSAIENYDTIYFIGCEIENRINHFSLPTQFSPADFWEVRSSIPIRLGASSYLAVTREERQLNLFNDVPKDAANVWIERTRNGKYTINYNYNFYDRLHSIENKVDKDINVHTIPWSVNNDNNDDITLIYSESSRRFDALRKRVSATSRYRAAYWVYQFALLQRIHNLLDHRPVILILDDVLETDKVESYARTCGFYIPENGSLIRKLEHIEHHPHGMLVIGKERFFDIVEWRKDSPYCYVWDHMAVEKHMMMWRSFDNRASRTILNDGVEEEGTEIIGTTYNDSYQAALLSIWPIYEYYFKFIKANCAESSMYIMDSYMEEYHTLSSVWGTTSRGLQLWDNEEQYNRALTDCRTIFSDDAISYRSDDDLQTAMDVILATLIKTDDPEKQAHWSDLQKEVLPQILSKQANYLVSIPTGGGKSVLFQGPALYNAAYNNKLSIVVCPLKALMQDQIKELEEKGFITNVDFLNGDRSFQEVQSVYRKINGGEIALLYVTPERFRSRSFLSALTTRMANDHGLEYMIFDEAHCISQWGMDFRPEYLNVIRLCKEFSNMEDNNMCIAMFSATVTEMIYNQINEVVPIKWIGQGSDKMSYNPVRDHISMDFKEVPHSIDARVREVVNYIIKNHIDAQRSRMLIFCKTRNQCEEVAMMLTDALTKNGILNPEIADRCVGYFHAGMESADREDIYNRFKDEHDPLYILCATKAFGMGMDIPNIHYIVHLAPPSVLEDYLQEVGRAGRNKEMYHALGFSTENPIPTVCLYSKEDIRQSKELLLQNTLSWKNIEEIRASIQTYIAKIQPIEKTKEYPIVIPNTLWAKDQFDHDFTSFRLGQYWLERLGRIKLGYLSPTHINITVLDKDSEGNSLDEKLRRLGHVEQAELASRLMAELRNLVKQQNNSTVQASLQVLAGNLSIHTTKLLDCIIWCVKMKLIRIEEETRCHVAFTRLSEVEYMLGHPYVEVAFHIILNATKELLHNGRLGAEQTYALSDIYRYIRESDTLQKIVKYVEKESEDGKKTNKPYMVWYREDDKQKNKGLSIAKSYRDDLYNKRSRQVFTLLELIPNVKVQSYLDTEHKRVLQSIIIEKNTWKEFLKSFEPDCKKLLEYIFKHKQPVINWSQAIIDLNIDDKGFIYFDSILRYLNGMGYLSADAILPTGIEVYTTDTTCNAIEEDTNDTSETDVKKAFDEAIEIRQLRLCVMDALTSKVKGKSEFSNLISKYFSTTNITGFISLLSRYYDDDDPMWKAFRSTAIKNAEEAMKDNPEQWAIYNEDSNIHVNVEAGPGSGKTHLLTMKCAKLIYRQHVNPQNILVIAYNRAVINELKSRLTKLFTELGLSRSASKLHVHTFHSLAKRVCEKAELDNYTMKEWESILLNILRDKPNKIRAIMPDLSYVFIDEFQDITQTRLDVMLELRNIYNPLTFFTIGDRDQSIYGFEKIESMNPDFYYAQLYEKLKPKKMTMRTNYRSYPKILEVASRYLPDKSQIPRPCRRNIEKAPSSPYVYIYERQRDWAADFANNVQWLKHQGIQDLAVFFRTNNEVYRGYSLIKSLNINGVRIRIQGVSAGELYRMREISAVLWYIGDKNGNKKIIFEKRQTELEIKNELLYWINKRPHWDIFYLDIAFVLILDYLDITATDDESHTYADMAASIIESLKEDNPQLYKLYEDKRFAERRLYNGQDLNVVLTTMHKVKGLEFDGVMITPSGSPLPIDPSKGTQEQIEEERRLLYVAFTRARKYLFVYKGERELAVEQLKPFSGQEDRWGIRENEVELKNYNIGYNAGDNFSRFTYIAKNVSKNDPVTIVAYYKECKNVTVYNIIHKETPVGQLSSKSNIARRMRKEGIEKLEGFFVSDIFWWSYKDTLAVDERNGTNYAAKWCEQAKQQGYIYIVHIAGYGKEC